MKVCNCGGRRVAQVVAVATLMLTCGVATKAAEPRSSTVPPPKSVPTADDCSPLKRCCPERTVPERLRRMSPGLALTEARRMLKEAKLTTIHPVFVQRPGITHERVYAVLPRPGERVCVDTRIEVFVAVPAKTDAAKTDAAKTDAAKTDAAKTDATKPEPTKRPYPPQVTAGAVIAGTTAGAAGVWLVARAFASRALSPNSPAAPQAPVAPASTAATSTRLRLRVRTDIG